MRLTRLWGVGLIAVLLLGAVLPSPIQAGLVLTRQSDNSGADHLYFGQTSGNPLIAELGRGSGTRVVFSSNTATTLVAQGQVAVGAQSGPLENISFRVDGASFSWALFNAFGQASKLGPATLTVETNEGTFTFDSTTSPLFTLDQGSNRYGLEADGTTLIRRVTLDVTAASEQDGLRDLRQVRLGGVQSEEQTTSTNPAPAGALLGIIGLLSLGGYAGVRSQRLRKPRQ